MRCVHIDDYILKSVDFAILTLSNMLRLHSNLNEDDAELLGTHIERLRKLSETAKEADDI